MRRLIARKTRPKLGYRIPANGNDAATWLTWPSAYGVSFPGI